MIIRSLRAEAFMRYELLELSDLPNGVIAITGENEAGKSTIGEAIAFALFGRSVRTETTDPAQAIHWEHDECNTVIEVEIAGAGLHRIERRVGRRGEFDAKLVGPAGETLAEGPLPVNQALIRLLGFDFPIFRYSFYVAQHELDLIQRDSRDNACKVVGDMLGISTLERAADHLRAELDEMRERGLTLDRDQAVAKALYTEMLPLREELAAIGGRVESAEREHASAEQGEGEVREATERARLAVDAGSERAQAMQQLGVGLFASVHGRHLLDGRARLKAFGARLTEQSGGAGPDALGQAQAVAQRGETLSALVQARAGQLQNELSAEGGPDAIPVRLRAQEDRIESESKSMLRRTLVSVVLLLLALAGGGAGAATRLPQGRPALTFAERLIESPRLGVQWTATPEKLTLPLGALGGLFLLAFVGAVVGRGKVKRRREEGVSERGRLEEVRRQRQSELDVCQAFQLGSLNQVQAALEALTDAGVAEALGKLQEAAGELMSSPQSPTQLLADASKRGRAGKLAGLVDKTLAGLQVTLDTLFPEGPPAESSGEQALPEGLDALETEIEGLTGVVTKARVELEALRAEGQPPAVETAVKAAQEAFNRAFQALGPDEQAKRVAYTEQSGMAELLKAREQAPSIEDMRAVLQRERDLGRETFGDRAALQERLREAEARLESGRLALVSARAELEDACLRSERLTASKRRLEELQARIGDLDEVLEPLHRQLRVHGEAIELFEDLGDALRARFGPGIERYVELVLPRLTQGRYRRTRVSEDLEIRIYSPERGDFVRLIELSLGTADQVLLALRLGLARALIGSRGISGGHFLFLDEPLVSADEAREQAFLNLLRTFDDEFTQIFVSSPRSMEGDLFARRIELTREVRTHRLEAGASA